MAARCRGFKLRPSGGIRTATNRIWLFGDGAATVNAHKPELLRSRGSCRSCPRGARGLPPTATSSVRTPCVDGEAGYAVNCLTVGPHHGALCNCDDPMSGAGSKTLMTRSTATSALRQRRTRRTHIAMAIPCTGLDPSQEV